MRSIAAILPVSNEIGNWGQDTVSKDSPAPSGKIRPLDRARFWRSSRHQIA